MKKSELEFVEALRKIGFSAPICESINGIRKAVFETSEAEKRKNETLYKKDGDDTYGNPWGSRAKRMRDYYRAMDFERAAEGAEGAEGEEDYSIEDENADDTIGSDESLKDALVERAIRKGYDIDDAKIFAERMLAEIDRALDNGE